MVEVIYIHDEKEDCLPLYKEGYNISVENTNNVEETSYCEATQIGRAHARKSTCSKLIIQIKIFSCYYFVKLLKSDVLTQENIPITYSKLMIQIKISKNCSMYFTKTS